MLRPTRLVLACTLAAALLAACSSPSPSPAPTGSTGSPSPAPAGCDFAGSLTDFYTAPTVTPGTAPGTILRCQQRTDITGLTGANAYRILYVTEAPKPATPYVAGYLPGVTPLVTRVSSGLVFVPTAAAPAGGRRIVAWDHGTVGMGDSCTPSKTAYATLEAVTPTSAPNKSYGFVLNMIANNWLVVATDYAGLGTLPATDSLQYLIGVSEAMDTLNIVRAGRAFPGSGVTSPTFGVYGQSQGGQASLFTGGLAATYAPELHLTAVVASDPAAEMRPLLLQQWDKTISWVLGPEVVVAWPQQNAALSIDSVVTLNGRAHYRRMSGECISTAGLSALVKAGPFFSQSITTNQAWLDMADAQTPPPITGVPVLVGQTTNDGVVLANTNATLQKAWCAAGSTLSMFWVPGVTPTPNAFLNGALAHVNSASVDALAAIDFLDHGFAGTPSTYAGITPCTTPPPNNLS